jgi:hypothetical protein
VELNRIAIHIADMLRPRLQLTKGQEWSHWTFGRPVSIKSERPFWVLGRPVSMHVERTEEVLWDCEDQLLDLGLLPEDVPSRIVLCAGCNKFEDKELLRRLGADLAGLVDGIATEPTK